jgi:hypothetical protein
MAQRETLLGRHEVMELEGRDRAIVAAQAASAASIVDEHLLDLAPASCDGLRATFRAAISAFTPPPERRQAVPCTPKHELVLTLF